MACSLLPATQESPDSAQDMTRGRKVQVRRLEAGLGCAPFPCLPCEGQPAWDHVPMSEQTAKTNGEKDASGQGTQGRRTQLRHIQPEISEAAGVDALQQHRRRRRGTGAGTTRRASNWQQRAGERGARSQPFLSAGPHTLILWSPTRPGSPSLCLAGRWPQRQLHQTPQHAPAPFRS